MKDINEYISESIFDIDDEEIIDKRGLKYDPDVQWASKDVEASKLKPLFEYFERLVSYYINNIFGLQSYKQYEEYISKLRWVIQDATMGNICAAKPNSSNYCDWTLSALEYDTQEDCYCTALYLYNSKKHNNDDYLNTDNYETRYDKEFIEEFNKRYAAGELEEFKNLFEMK